MDCIQHLDANETALRDSTRASFPIGSVVYHKTKGLFGTVTGYSLYYPNIELIISTDQYAGICWKLDNVILRSSLQMQRATEVWL